MTRKLLVAAALISALAMSGCASVQKASKSADAQAKLFVPTADKATIYIYRNEIVGYAIKMPLLIDGMAVGDTGPKSYVEQVLPPGTHTITSKSEKDSTLSLSTEAGHTYYVWQEIKIGWAAARSALHSVDEQTGRAAVKECSLIESSNFAQTSSAAQPMSGGTSPAIPAPVAEVTSPQAPAAKAPVAQPYSAPTAAPAETGDVLASTDSRVSSPVFNAAQNAAASKQCNRMIHTTRIDGTQAEFSASCYSRPPLRIACDGAQCTAM